MKSSPGPTSAATSLLHAHLASAKHPSVMEELQTENIEVLPKSSSPCFYWLWAGGAKPAVTTTS